MKFRFGCQHDEDSSCSQYPYPDKAIMHADVSQVWKFSECSQNAIDGLFKWENSYLFFFLNNFEYNFNFEEEFKP